MGNKFEGIVKTFLLEKDLDLIFYSKRLNIAIFYDNIQQKSNNDEISHKLIIIDLRGKTKPLDISGPMSAPFIRSIKNDDNEIVRVFVVSEYFN
jgi:hypothetical protein